MRRTALMAAASLVFATANIQAQLRPSTPDEDVKKFQLDNRKPTTAVPGEKRRPWLGENVPKIEPPFGQLIPGNLDDMPQLPRLDFKTPDDATQLDGVLLLLLFAQQQATMARQHEMAARIRILEAQRPPAEPLNPLWKTGYPFGFSEPEPEPFWNKIPWSHAAVGCGCLIFGMWLRRTRT